MKTSCGAIFYSFNPQGRLGIILGREGRNWLPFKGCCEYKESFEDAAIREIFEETCGIIKLNSIALDHKFASKHKRYLIGLVQVPYSLIQDFTDRRVTEQRANFCEKKGLRFFAIEKVLDHQRVHGITKASIRYYWNKLLYLRGGNANNDIIPQNTRLSWQCDRRDEETRQCRVARPVTAVVTPL